MTGNDLIEAEKQIMQSGDAVVVTDFSRPYLIALAARAANIPVETLKFMDARDFAKIAGEVRNFLLLQDSEDSPEETIPATSPATSSGV